MKNIDIVEIGDFISFKDHKMAVLDIDTKEGYAYVFCNDNHKCKRLPVDNLTKVKIEKKAACVSIIQAFFDDMTYMR